MKLERLILLLTFEHSKEIIDDKCCDIPQDGIHDESGEVDAWPKEGKAQSNESSKKTKFSRCAVTGYYFTCHLPIVR